MTPALPPFAPFPSASDRAQLPPSEWASCVEAWATLAEAHLSLPDDTAPGTAAHDASAVAFLQSLLRETAASGTAILGDGPAARRLLRAAFLLTSRWLQSPAPPNGLAQWDVLADLARVYRKKKAARLLSSLSDPARALLETSLAGLKKCLIQDLHAGLDGDVRAVEQRLDRLNPLLHASPLAASYFLAGSDFLDGLVACYRITNPPLRKVIVATTYLCLVGPTEGEQPNLALLTDQLYALKAAAEAHQSGPLHARDSLVPELVTATPLLQQLQRRLETSGTARSVLAALSSFRKPGGGGGGLAAPKRLVRRRKDKGKGREDQAMARQEIHVHRASQISQVQDLFPELGSGFVSKLLDEYGEDTEQVVAHLLEGDLPAHLQNLDRTEQLAPPSAAARPPRRDSFVPRSTPPPPSPPWPARRNVFDDDELDRLAVDASRLHIGKRDPAKTADDLLRSDDGRPRKAAILAALAAFDSDDDERDDTYDAEDVGGAVLVTDAAPDEIEGGAAGAAARSGGGSEGEEMLYRAYVADPSVFGRDAATRRGKGRAQLRAEVGMTDEAIEGWAVMLERNPQQKRRLDARYGDGAGGRSRQAELASTSWRAGSGGDEDGGEEVGAGPSSSATRGGSRGRGRGRGGGGRGGRGGVVGGGGGGGGGGGSGGNVAGPTGDRDTEAARRRKEANKGSRANHNRRDQRARKMARGGFPG